MDADEAQQASYTMVRSAVRRATHQLLDVPIIFNDPVSVGLVEESSKRAIHAARDTHRGRLETLLRSLFVLRSRFAEDRLAAILPAWLGLKAASADAVWSIPQIWLSSRSTWIGKESANA